MKFTNGFWWLRDGIVPNYPATAHEVEATDDALHVFAPVQPIDDRGDSVNCPVVSVSFTSPIEGVIRVRLTHHAGQRQTGPRFELADTRPAVTARDGDDEATFTTGDLSVHVAKGDAWHVEFRHRGRPVTSSSYKNMGHMTDTRTGATWMKDELAMGVGECIYGLGERFTPFVKNGQVVDMWNDDGGTSSDIAYKNVPFYLSSNGYGVFVDHAEKVSFEVGSEKVTRVGFSVPGETLEYCVIGGDTPADILERYTALTGRPALVPPWSFGLWLTTSFTTDYDEQTVTGFVQGMADRDIPLHVFHFDCFWMKGFHWIDLEWDADVFPEPAAMLGRLKRMGVKICVWINPYVAQRSSMFAEGMQRGYFLKRPNGDLYQRDMWQAGMALIDFTNPDAVDWYKGKLARLVDTGVDSFKTDFGEQVPTDVVYHDGSDPLKMHNYYTQLYNRAVFEVLEDKLGKGEATLFARSATAGGQRYPVHWGGDCTATFESMAESLRGGLSLGLSGFGFWSHDIGGFETQATPDVYKRWVAFGLLSSHSRLHGSKSYRVPWLYDDEAVDVLRYFTKLKCRLMPYIYRKAVEAHTRGTPVMRAMCFEFPDDIGCRTLDRQYMLGEALLVAPVMSADGAVEYYLPDGRWTDFATGESIDGGRWVRGEYDYMHLPLLARENAVVPVGAVDDRPDYDLADDVVFHAFALTDGASLAGEVPDHTGADATVVQVERTGSEITITPAKASGNWRVLLRNTGPVVGVDGGTAADDPLGTMIAPDSLAQTVRIALGG